MVRFSSSSRWLKKNDLRFLKKIGDIKDHLGFAEALVLLEEKRTQMQMRYHDAERVRES